MIVHPFLPLYDADSQILILGSFPSVKSREEAFFYGHPQNRFWKVIAAVFKRPVPRTVAEKKRFLSETHLALWDVIASCEITGSADSSIRNVLPNDLRPIFEAADIRAIFANGNTALRYYNRYQRQELGREAVGLPSTSPANATWSLERLIDAWKILLLPGKN